MGYDDSFDFEVIYIFLKILLSLEKLVSLFLLVSLLTGFKIC